MPETLSWSLAARSCWGKTSQDTAQWLPLVQHLEDAAGVAAALWENLPANVRRLFCQVLSSDDATKAFIQFAAGTHDVGKAAQHFAFKAYAVGRGELADAMVRQGLAMPTWIHRPVPHGALGQAHLQSWLIRRYQAEPRKALRLSGIIGGHHGRNPAGPDIEDANQALADESAEWHAVRDEILDGMAERTDAQRYLRDWLRVDIPVTVQVLTTGLVIMADWIASDEHLFPYGKLLPTRDRVSNALKKLQLPTTWQPTVLPANAEILFSTRFPHLRPAQPNAMQHAVVQAALSTDEPGLIVLEAPMGMGKTEAALMAAEVLAYRFGLGGVFVGLPTMATSNPMFGRIRSWLDRVPSDAKSSITLAHSKAALNDEYAGLMPWAQAKSIFDDEVSSEGEHPSYATAKQLNEASAVVHSWFMGRKRGILANHVIGTIDQSLFAALKAKHVVLRHVGLASKVVIIDEVHAADDYMRTYLKRVLQWLGAYRTPVILMSATLPPAQRAELVAAYRDGSGANAQEITAPRNAYPLVITAGAETTAVAVPQTGPSTQIHVELLPDDDQGLVRTVTDLLIDGGCLGIIRNTVSRAQETYRLLKSTLDCEIVLMHSRFLAPHRAARERELVELLGRTESNRPKKLVVVGTQVLEQSLDIDFDALITDLAPVDLVLQRIGRLHRHPRTRPTRLKAPRCYLAGVDDWSVAPPSFPPGSTFVYGEDTLLRAAAVFLDHREIDLPGAIPALVERAYTTRPTVPPEWAPKAVLAYKTAYKDRQIRMKAAEAFLLADPSTTSNLTALIEGNANDPEDPRGYQQVRDSEDSLEVIVVIRSGNQVRLPDGIGSFSGRELPIIGPPDHEVARATASCTVALPRTLSGPWTVDRVILELERGLDVSSWQTSPWLKGQLVLALDESGTGRLAGRPIRYDPDMGLMVETPEKEGNW